MKRTKRSLAARLTIRKLVTVLILLCLHTTSTTKVLPIPPTRHSMIVEIISNLSMSAEGLSASVLLLVMACDIADLNKSEHQHDMWNVARKTAGLPFLASTCRVRKDVLGIFFSFARVKGSLARCLELQIALTLQHSHAAEQDILGLLGSRVFSLTDQSNLPM